MKGETSEYGCHVALSCHELWWHVLVRGEEQPFFKQRERVETPREEKRMFLGLEGEPGSLRHLSCCSAAVY